MPYGVLKQHNAFVRFAFKCADIGHRYPTVGADDEFVAANVYASDG